MKTNSIKCAFAVLLTAFTAQGALVQKNNVYEDIGISWSRLHPGMSLTYNYNVARWVGIGAGLHVYDFHAIAPSFQMVPALYGEMRFTIRPRTANQFFAFLDLGINLYAREDDSWMEGNIKYTVANDNGTYGGFGIGYAWGRDGSDFRYYVSLKTISNSYHANGYNLATGEQTTVGMGDNTLVTSFGLKL